ncbi:MAG: protein kinase [Isosphaeraceae bacterium]
MTTDGPIPPREPDPFETVDPSALKSGERPKPSEPEPAPQDRAGWTVFEAASSPPEPVSRPEDTESFATDPPRDLGASTVPAAEDDPFLTYVASDGHVVSEDNTPSRRLTGRFRLVRSHARGGLGEVLLAIDEELRREVALKRIRDHHADDPDSRARFLLEAEITGNLEHPGIVPVYGLGIHEDGRPYYAMRFIRGENLKDAIDDFHRDDPGRNRLGHRPPAFRKLLNRFIDVCNTIHYAHSRGVIHRDIKPVNIMLGPYGETLVVDWGLAKPLHVGDAEGPSEAPPESVGPPPQDQPGAGPRYAPSVEAGMALSQAGFAMGTPAYISPEQAEGRIGTIGPVSDVFLLGATLYEVLTGRPPYRGESVVSILADAAEARFPTPRTVNPKVPAALDAVCLKAMAREPGDRYATAHALAEDIERWLADDRVTAMRESVVRRAGRWVRRNLVAATVASLVFLVVAVAAVSAWTVHIATIDKDAALAESRLATTHAENSLKKAEEAGQEATQARELAEQRRSAAEAAGKEAASARDLAEVRLYGTSIALAQAELQNAKIARADELLDRCAAPLRGWEWSYLKRLGHTEAATLWGHGNIPTRVRFEADGRNVRSADAEGRVILWDLQTARMKETRVLIGPVGALHPSRPLALAAGRNNSSVWLHSLDSPDPPRQLVGISGVLSAVEFSPDGKWAAVGSAAGDLAVWRVDSPREPVHRFKAPQGTIVALAFSAGGEHLASSSVGGWIDVWKLEADAGKSLVRHVQAHPGTAAYIVDLEFSPDGKSLASASHDSTVHLWDWSAEPIAEPRVLRGHQFAAWAVAFSPNGKVLASGGDSTVRLWDVATGQELSVLLGHEDSPGHLAFSPDGRRIASAAKDLTVKVWDVPGDFTGSDATVSLDAGAPRAASGEADGPVTRPARRVFHDQQDAVSTVALTPDGRRLVTGGWDGRVAVRDLDTGKVVAAKKSLFSVGSVDVHPDGRRVAVGYGGPLSNRVGSVALWDHTNDRIERTFTGLTAPVTAVKFSADGRRLLAATGAVARAFPGKGHGGGLGRSHR